MLRNVPFALVASFTLGLAPFTPEPHLVGKVRWVLGGAVGMQPADFFDLLMHGAPFLWLAIALVLRLPMFNAKALTQLREQFAAGAMLVDVRSPEEFQGGSIEGAKSVPVHTLPKGIKSVSAGDKKTPLVVFCRSGARSAQAARALRGAGYERVLDLGGLGNAQRMVTKARSGASRHAEHDRATVR